MNEKIESGPLERLAEHLSARALPPVWLIHETADWLDYSLNRCGLVVVEEQSLTRTPPQPAPNSDEIECPVCKGSGFSGQGSGYGDVCSECGGQKYLSAPNSDASFARPPHRYGSETQRETGAMSGMGEGEGRGDRTTAVDSPPHPTPTPCDAVARLKRRCGALEPVTFNHRPFFDRDGAWGLGEIVADARALLAALSTTKGADK